MSGLIVDGVTGEKLAKAEGMLPICDRSGKVLGIFQPFYQPKSSEEAKDLSPFSDEEIERLRNERGSRPLSEIWKDLDQKDGQ